MSLASIEYIDIDERGVARIVGHRTKVIQIVMDKMAHAWSPEEIRSQYPHLTLAQIHAAFAYYYDHIEQLDAQIAADLAEAEVARQLANPSPTFMKLRAMGKLP